MGRKKIITALSLVIAITLVGVAAPALLAQRLDSDNYSIIDSTVDSGGGVSESANFGLLSSMGNPVADARLESDSYALGVGFPSGIMANVPLVICAEGDTDSGSSDCQQLPNAAGMQGECGTPGCYDRGKIEIDPQDNPIDTLFLIQITDTDTGTDYYLQSDYSIGTNYTIADYMTLCELQGRNDNDPDCDNDTKAGWDESLQSSNVYGLGADRQYTVSVRALSGDFTETQYSPAETMQTTLPSLVMDIDIGPDSTANTSAPHVVDLGSLAPGTVTTASDRIWLTLGTNASQGMSTLVQDLNGGLLSGSSLISSVDADLDSAANGFGIKTESTSEVALGPLLADAKYDTSGADEVGGLDDVTAERIFFTEEAGGNRGPISEARAGIQVKSKVDSSFPAGSYSDVITFTMVGNF